MKNLMVMALVVFMVSLLAVVSFADDGDNYNGADEYGNGIGDGIADDPYGNDERNGSEYSEDEEGISHGGNGYKTINYDDIKGDFFVYPVLVIMPIMIW